MRPVKVECWVVYTRNPSGTGPGGGPAVCEQSEWDQLERDCPGRHSFIKGGFANEADAERLARPADITPAPRRRKPKAPTPPPHHEPVYRR